MLGKGLNQLNNTSETSNKNYLFVDKGDNKTNVLDNFVYFRSLMFLVNSINKNNNSIDYNRLQNTIIMSISFTTMFLNLILI